MQSWAVEPTGNGEGIPKNHATSTREWHVDSQHYLVFPQYFESESRRTQLPNTKYVIFRVVGSIVTFPLYRVVTKGDAF